MNPTRGPAFERVDLALDAAALTTMPKASFLALLLPAAALMPFGLRALSGAPPAAGPQAPAAGPQSPAAGPQSPAAGPQSPAAGPQAQPDSPRVLTPAELELQTRLAEQSIQLDLAHGYCALPVEVAVREDLLEYLLVGAAGASHESAFTTVVAPSVLNVALLALGVTPGRNADWRRKDPLPSPEEIEAGVSPYEIQPPTGDGFYVYVGWRKGDEEYFYRVEDLMRNLATGQAMERAAWVYLGSQQLPRTRTSGPDDTVFAAEVYRNLINVAFFREGFTLLTGALPECVEQSIWMLNAWLVPERGSQLVMFLSRARLSGAAEHVRARLPELQPQAGERR